MVLIAASATMFFGMKAILTHAFHGVDRLMATENAEARKRLAAAKTDRDKVDPLADIAKYDFDQGNLTEARQYATQLLAIEPKLQQPDDPDRGTAIHDGNMVLGRLALRDGNRDAAKSYLLKAGTTNGSPALDSFGPNMGLAKDLLEVGEKDTVLQYLQECHKFWGFQPGAWEEQIKNGQIPDFGANLIY